ncbi:hypothetical protein VTJ49DRAFT_7177 [Mycothermus thermophilus]|uniref:N-acetyltransferase domain-containing protein n=1 Tax=Humicola insolens TaxID=85995 RepID=A0ABR3VRJ1_HUMIN
MAESSSKPRIRIREATQADADTIAAIHFGAFEDSIMDQLMFPGGPSADAKQKFAARIFPRPVTDGEAPPKSQTFVYVAKLLPNDESAGTSGEVVAFAKWRLQAEPLPEEEWKKDQFECTTEVFGEGCDITVINAFIGEMTRMSQRLAKGEAALYLGILACTPSRQRLGAGSALMKWGVDLADRLGLPAWVEASPIGYGLYRKFGYQDVDVLDLNITEKWGVTNTDGSNWGANTAVELKGPAPEGVFRTVILRRPPKATTS